MNMKQTAQPRSSANGFGRHKFDPSSRVDNKFQTGKSNPNRVVGAGIPSINKDSGPESSSRDRLVYLTTCLIGHHVDVQVKNGSVYTGIFHATNADKNFGIILKMARLLKDVSFRGHKSGTDSVSKAPTKTLIIPAHELVQVIAKDVPITCDGLSSEPQGESQQDIMIDSYISQSRHVGAGRELERWVPDEDAPQRPELENIFDSPWTRKSWDQFKVNESLFGVRSTFNEELYTTKLEKGPRMRELEAEAKRIAREIEGEETQDLHLAEERGAYLPANIDIDEETKYSSVFRGFDDSGCADENEVLDSHDLETFGDSYGPGFVRSFADVASGKSGKALEGDRASSGSLSKEASEEFYRPISQLSNNSTYVAYGFEDESRAQENYVDDQGGNNVIKKTSNKDIQAAKSEDFQSPSDMSRDGSDKAAVGVSSITSTSSMTSTKVDEKASSSGLSEDNSSKLRVTEATDPRRRVDNTPLSTLEGGAVTSTASAPSLSPSSSVGSLSSEKSTLNPNAKEFRFNPNAKSFVPTQSPLRPVSPVNEPSFYYPTNVHTVPHMHGIPVGIGVGPSFAGQQPGFFNPQAAAMQSAQPYFPANAPQFGQPMLLGHPRQVMYMPGHPSEMPYRGREY
ncbi:polyadenylate-binding protein-interacting protein 3-like [Silene latifolia]|uniref:polyadenylate-binding protein-interacting protein 3-like n=1 Tax=Silene latifolia TaxID=37657 RepID=UPI003D78734C